jgi:hypothetical protein
MAVNAFGYCRMIKQCLQAQRTINTLLRKSAAEAAGRVLINPGAIQCRLLAGDLNRSTQHFILEGKDQL